MAHFSWGNMAADASASTIDSSAGLLPSAIIAPATGGAVLTVGVGEMFTTLAAALASANDGTTILVDAGTYTDDFATVSSSVTIVGVGGMANFVADTPPKNEKGILTVDNNVTIENCSFSGATVSDANGGNGAGIRYEGGRMVLQNDSFIGNQDGILGSPSIAGLTNTISIDHCLFQNNGSGSGYTHNLYIGNVDSLTFTNNISEGAVVGHELKSRAYVNDIENNIFLDGPSGTASYSIDLPNGGQDRVLNNVIEKGMLASNQAAVHFGGEGIPYARSSLLVSGNQFQNDYGPAAVAVFNQTAIPVAITGNQFNGFGLANLAQGPATETSNTDGSGNSLPDQTLTGVLPGNTLVITDAASHTISLTGTLLAVEGGAGLLTVTAVSGHVIAIGGSGGMNFYENSGSGGNTITTMAGATNYIRVTGQDLIDSEGTDKLSIGAGNVTAILNGIASVSDGTGNDQFNINGTATIAGHGGNPVVALGALGSVSINGSLKFLHVQSNGGSLHFAIIQGGALEALTTTGAVDVQVDNATMNIATAGGRTGATLHLGVGAATILSVGADTIWAGSGAETVIVEGGANIYAGSGALSIYGRGDTVGANVFGAGGTYTIAGDTGNVTYYGGAGASTVQAVLSRITLVGGAGRLTVNGGSDDVMSGGSGGLVYSATDGGGANTIVTAAGAHDTLTLAASDVVSSYGIDVINAGTGNQLLAIYGNSIVNGSTGNSRISFTGIDTLNGAGNDQCVASAGATLTVNSGNSTTVTETGALVKLNLRGSAAASATISGGAAYIDGESSTGLSITTMVGASTSVTLSTGTANLVTNGSDIVRAGSGAAGIYIKSASATIYGGTGTLNVFNADLSASDTQTVVGGKGNISITQESGALNFIGGTGSASIDGGSGLLYVTAGAGDLTVTNGQGGETLVAGGGTLNVSLASNGGTVEFGSGIANIQTAAYGNGDLFQFVSGHGGGLDTITNFRPGLDSLVFSGVTVTSETVVSGQTSLVLSDSTHVFLNGYADTQSSILHH